MLSNVTLLCFFASYLCALVLETTRLWVKSGAVRWCAIGFAAAGFVAHMAYLFARARDANLPPLLSSTHDWLLVLAFLAVVVYLFVSVLDRSLGFGLFLLPIVVLLVGASRFVNRTTSVQLSAERGWGMLHASMWVLGAAGVVIGFVLSLMYLVQHHRLRQKKLLQHGLELPSLERLSRLNWWAVVVSVPLLTLGMVTGVGLSLAGDPHAETVRLSEPSIVLSVLLWCGMMALFVWLLVAQRTPGRLVAWRTMWACGFLLLTLIVLLVFRQGGVHGVVQIEDRPGVYRGQAPFFPGSQASAWEPTAQAASAADGGGSVSTAKNLGSAVRSGSFAGMRSQAEAWERGQSDPTRFNEMAPDPFPTSTHA